MSKTQECFQAVTMTHFCFFSDIMVMWKTLAKSHCYFLRLQKMDHNSLQYSGIQSSVEIYSEVVEKMFWSWSHTSSRVMPTLYQKRDMPPWNTCYLQVSLYLSITYAGVPWCGWWFERMLRIHNSPSSNPVRDLCLPLYGQNQNDLIRGYVRTDGHAEFQCACWRLVQLISVTRNVFFSCLDHCQ